MQGKPGQTNSGLHHRNSYRWFSKHRFLPVYEPSADVPPIAAVETVYLRAVKNLTAYYKVETIDVRKYLYPYNILLSNWDISGQIKTKGRYRKLRIEKTENHKTEVSVRETVNTGSTLFFIPLVPLFKALHVGGSPCAPLLLAVCTYLYQKAGVCHYKEDESYLCYLYEIIDNWIEDDRETMDESDYKEQRAILDEVLFVGDQMKGFLSDETELQQLQSRIQNFKPADQFGRNCLKLAKETLALWVEFPGANIYQHLSQDDENEEDDCYSDGTIKVTDYISFIGEMKSCVYDSIMTMLNDDFNERSGLQHFESSIIFNNPQRKLKDVLAYEERVIAVIEDLCDLIPELT